MGDTFLIIWLNNFFFDFGNTLYFLFLKIGRQTNKITAYLFKTSSKKIKIHDNLLNNDFSHSFIQNS